MRDLVPVGVDPLRPEGVGVGEYLVLHPIPVLAKPPLDPIALLRMTLADVIGEKLLVSLSDESFGQVALQDTRCFGL